MRGKPRIHEMRGSLRGKRRIHGAKEQSNAPVGAGLARHGASPGKPHAGQAPHPRNARLPARQAPHSRAKERANAPVGAGLARHGASPGMPPCGASPASTKCAAPCARQAPHSRDMRASKRPRRCRACPARASPEMPPCGASPASTKCGLLRESPASMGNTLFRGAACRHGRLAGHCLNAGARPLHAQRAATRRTGRCTCPPLSRGRPTHCRALSARHRRRHAHTQA